MQEGHVVGIADAAEVIFNFPAVTGKQYTFHGLHAVNVESTSVFGDISATFTPILMANGTTAAVLIQHVGSGATPVAIAGSGYPLELTWKPRVLEKRWYGLVTPKGLAASITIVAAQPDAGTMHATLWYDLT